MLVFYQPLIHEGYHKLSEQESHHCVQVLRHQPGDSIRILDGKGGIHDAILRMISKRLCTFEVTGSTLATPKSFQTHLAIAPTKNVERIEWMVEKLSEIGLDELTFIRTKHTERIRLRFDRLEKKTISAMKQSGNPFKTKINEITSFHDFIANDTSEIKTIAHVNENHKSLIKTISPNKNISIMAGPEGDFSPEELESAKAKGYVPVSLGSNTLRTETAGIAGCLMVNFVNEGQNL